MNKAKAERKDYEIIETFTVLYAGWELDHVAWVARNKKGELVLLMTDHGSLWDFGNDVSRLHEHITVTSSYTQPCPACAKVVIAAFAAAE